MYDLIIIGAGPAGMTAAIYAARRKLKFLILSMDIGGQMSWSSEVDNYPGVPDSTGVALVQKFQKHLKDYNITIKTGEVIRIDKKKKTCIVSTKKRKFESKTVIIASGKKPKKLGVPGEEKFTGKGINYCATCDAPLFKNKIVAVVGGGNSGLEAALFLSKHAKKVYILDIMKKLGGEAYLKEKVQADKKIQVILGAKTTEILGGKFVSGMKYEKQGKQEKLAVQGIFVEIGLITETEFVKVKKNKWKEIMIFRSTKTHEENMTSLPGVFAAGDVTDVPSKQIIVAAGEGAKACLAAVDYITRWK
jgi:alkyl hydroperoxide reductase subunit F